MGHKLAKSCIASVLPWSVIAERRRIIGTVCSYMSLRGLWELFEKKCTACQCHGERLHINGFQVAVCQKEVNKMDRESKNEATKDTHWGYVIK